MIESWCTEQGVDQLLAIGRVEQCFPETSVGDHRRVRVEELREERDEEDRELRVEAAQDVGVHHRIERARAERLVAPGGHGEVGLRKAMLEQSKQREV